MSLVFVVMVLVNITLLNVTATVVETETSVELSVGLTEETVGRLVVVNPMVVWALASELLTVSLTESVTFVLKVFSAIRLLAGVMVKVVSLPDATGVADI